MGEPGTSGNNAHAAGDGVASGTAPTGAGCSGAAFGVGANSLEQAWESWLTVALRADRATRPPLVDAGFGEAVEGDAAADDDETPSAAATAASPDPPAAAAAAAMPSACVALFPAGGCVPSPSTSGHSPLSAKTLSKGLWSESGKHRASGQWLSGRLTGRRVEYRGCKLGSAEAGAAQEEEEQGTAGGEAEEDDEAATEEEAAAAAAPLPAAQSPLPSLLAFAAAAAAALSAGVGDPCLTKMKSTGTFSLRWFR